MSYFAQDTVRSLRSALTSLARYERDGVLATNYEDIASRTPADECERELQDVATYVRATEIVDRGPRTYQDTLLSDAAQSIEMLDRRCHITHIYDCGV